MLRELSRNAVYVCSDSAKHAGVKKSKHVWYLPALEFSRLKGRAGRVRAAEPDQCVEPHVGIPWVFSGLLQSPLPSAFNVQIATTVLESRDVQLNLFCQQKPSHKQMTEL